MQKSIVVGSVVCGIILAGFVAFFVMSKSDTQAPQGSVQETDQSQAERSDENVIRITNGEWPPYLSEKLPHHGLVSRIVTEAFAREGIVVEYGFFPWNRSLEIARAGSWDGSAVWAYNDDRARDFYLSDSVIDTQWVFFHLKTTGFDWDTISDLSKYRIGATLGYDYSAAFEAAEDAGSITVERIATDEQNFEKLLEGRIDIFPLDLAVGTAMLQKNFTPDERARITYHKVSLKTDPLLLLLSKQIPENKEMITRFNRGLAEIKADGTYDSYFDDIERGVYSTED